MIKEQLDSLIKESMLAKSHIRTMVLRDIKTKFMEWETAKNAKPLDEQAVIRKMIADREVAADIYKTAGKLGLATAEVTEAKYLKEFEEEKVDDAIIQNMIKDELKDGPLSLGDIMKRVKQKYPTADMKMASTYARGLLPS
jgi:uncharacterized protein YqeY